MSAITASHPRGIGTHCSAVYSVSPETAANRADLHDGAAGHGAPELWIFERGAFEIWSHDGASYRRGDRSPLLPDLDFAQLARFVVRSDQPQALKEWREAIRTK